MPLVIKRLKSRLFSCFVLFFFGITATAQTTKVEELLNQLHKNDPDTTQIKVMRKLSAAYTSVDPIKKFYYANQYRLLAEKNGIDSSIANGYLDMGISYAVRSNLDSALYYFRLGQEKSKASNYINGIARSYVNIGFIYDRLDRKKESVKNYEESLKIYRKLNFKKGINQCIMNLGSLYFDLGEYKTADIYFRQVLESVKETPNDQAGLATALFSLGSSNRKIGDQKKSLEYYQKSLAIREKIGDLNGIALSNWGIGLVMNNTKKYHKALEHLEIALKHNRALKNIYQEAIVLMSVSYAHVQLKDYKNAEKAAKLGLAKAKESNSKGLVVQALEYLVEVNKAQKKYADALRHQSEYMAINDSINNSKTKKEVILNDLRRINYDNKNLEKRNKTINAKISDYIITISIITFLLVAVAILLVLYYKKNSEKNTANALLQKQKKEIAEVNEELGALNEELTMQMDIVSTQNIELEKLNKVKNKFFSIVSHDIRAPLNNLKMLLGLYRKGTLNEQELSELLTKLEDTIYTTADFLDNLLEWSKNQLDGMMVNPTLFHIHQIVDDNIKLMDSQIKLKSLKVNNSIHPEITVFADPDMINVVVRNLLSNAIKFCRPDDQVFFDAKLENDMVVLSIRDTGPGIDDGDKENLFNLANTMSTGTSGEKGYQIGLILCKDMILQNNGNIHIDSHLDSGTIFYITLPAKSVV